MTPRMIPVMRVVAIRIAGLDSEHTFDAADHAAHDSADNCADRPSNAATFMKSMRGSTGNALRLRGEWCDREKCGGDQKFHLHCVPLRPWDESSSLHVAIINAISPI